jgi:hypothetical protein
MTEAQDNHDTELLDLLRAATDALSAMSAEDREAHGKEAGRAGQCLAYAELIIRDSDRELVPASARDQAAQALTNIRDNVMVALSPPVGTDALLEALSRYPASRGRDAQQAATDIAERFQRSTSQRLRAVEGEAASAQSRLETNVAETRTKLDELGTTLDSRANEIDQRISDVNASIDTTRTAVDQLVREYQERFAAQEQEHKAALVGLREANDEQLSQIREGQEAAGREHVEKMEALRDRAASFLDVIANTGMASQFQDRANKDEKQAGLYRVATIVIGLGAVVLAAVLVLVGEKGPEYAFAKLGIVTTMLLVAGFTANHARQKQNAGESWREFELKLSGFGAVLETLPPEKAEEDQRWLFRELFARGGVQEPDGLLGRRLRPVDRDRDAA